MKLRTLNLGCGTSPMSDDDKHTFVNMDMLKQKVPTDVSYVRHDLMKPPYPFEESSFDVIMLFHTIEHIPENEQPIVLCEMRRLIKSDGVIMISYPEFREIAKNYLENKGGKRDFWKATIYGRGLTNWDRHKALMDTPYFIKELQTWGLETIKHKPENGESYNTVLFCKRAAVILSHEELMGQEFGKKVDFSEVL